MKIQFIIVGWHYNQIEFYEGLKEMTEINNDVKVFFSCHKEPVSYITENFDYKLFPNVGEEFVAYQQAIDYLNVDDDTVCFFIHDDVIVKNWEFINICVEKLNQGYKFLGNCFNYPVPEFNPHTDYLKVAISEELEGKLKPIDYAREDSKHIFQESLSPTYVIRGSFICCKYSDLKAIGEFEPRKEAWVPLEWSEEHQKVCYRGTTGLGSTGNMFMFMLGYKMNKVFGTESISYLSDRYLDSDYLYEMGRGELDPNNPMR
tara:strand:+ start:6042 stop:6821 length:780 start_codon:yes stop_codon:yes gene_type:complete